MKEAYLYETRENNKVRCRLCSHMCLIDPGSRGKCGVRENRGGKLFSLVYDKLIARHVDPIEKKPLFHFLPGSLSYSIATVGCNFTCRFCQNSDISQISSESGLIRGEKTTPEEIVRQAEVAGTESISYTYTEPTVYFELAYDTARIATSRGIKNIFVTNGFMSEACLRELHPHLDAANVDLKAFSDAFYREQCGARLEPVLRTIETMHRLGVWIEVTTLIIPGYNDSQEQLRAISGFIAGIDPGIPWHVSRFHPTYLLITTPPTPVETLRTARDIGYEAGLQYVYTGNIPHEQGENTLCHKCNSLLIERNGFRVQSLSIEQGRCPRCGAEIPGIWAV
jgi:pyruvate formate lyase activating enzyme